MHAAAPDGSPSVSGSDSTPAGVPFVRHSKDAASAPPSLAAAALSLDSDPLAPGDADGSASGSGSAGGSEDDPAAAGDDGSTTYVAAMTLEPAAAREAAMATAAVAAVLGGSDDAPHAARPGRGGEQSGLQGGGDGAGTPAATPASEGRSTHEGRGGGRWGGLAEPPAYTAALADVTIVGVGHSMGGCLMLTHLLHSRALRRPHGLSGAVLLSPAGLHRDVGLAPRALLSLTGLVALRLVPDGPFPLRSSKLQNLVAGLVQDMKRSQGTSGLVSAIGSVFFGGRQASFALGRISLFDYPLGGTSVRVMAHGCQSMFAKETTPFSFGAEENLRRYGTREPESYRCDFGLIDVPVDFLAGELDALIPPSNIRLLAAALQAASPGNSGYTEYPGMGHLDFTLGVSDGVISHVLGRLEHFTAAANDPRKPALPPFPLDVAAERAADATLRDVAAVAEGRSHGGVSDRNWLPAAECARQYPFLNCYMKRAVAFRGLDRRRERLWDAFGEPTE